MTEDLERAFREIRDKLLSKPVSPRVETPADINKRYCRYVAETVANRVGDQYDLQLLEDGGWGFVHTWIACDGRHYDAECPGGVEDHRELPFFDRHPAAAMNVEPGTADPSELRKRGLDPFHPAI